MSAASRAKHLALGDYRLTVGPVGAGVGLRVAARLAALVAPVASGAGGTKTDMARAFGALIANPDLPDHLDAIVKALGETTLVSAPQKEGAARTFKLTDPGIFDEMFAGNYAEFLEWLYLALEVNFSSFFAVSPALLAKLTAKLAKPDAPAAEPAQ